MAAGLASTGAAFVTSRFGVAGTLLGAALTAMIITGGSAILKAYIENAAGRMRGAHTRLRSRREGNAANATVEQNVPPQPESPPGRPDLRNNLVGRMRAAVDWFRNLPTPARRPIVIKALVAAGIAFAICMVAVWGAEKVIGNSLSCGFWGTCTAGATPGIDPLGLNGTGAGSSISGGRLDVGGGGGGGGGVIDSIQQNPAVPDGPDFLPGGSDSSASPAPEEEAPSSASPAPDAPAEEAPSSASPAAEPDASPAAEPRGGSDSSASPAP